MTTPASPAAGVAPKPLSGAPRPLAEIHDTALFDLDGVIYVGTRAVPRAPEMLARARQHGLRVAFVTNNSSRTPAAVADHLVQVGVPATVEEVVSSAQAAAGLVAERVPEGSRVLVVGGDGLVAALGERGLVPVYSAAQAPAAVIQGFHPDVGWRQLAEGAYALANDLPWIASNVDVTLPTDGGLAPGNGALVEVIRLATGKDPIVAGKPAPPLFHEAVARTHGKRPVVVGDRLDTDIQGAHASGMPSLVVLTGVTGLAELVAAPPNQRPTYLAHDLTGLFQPHPAPGVDGTSATCGGWKAELRSAPGGARVVLDGDGDPLDGARALLAAVWAQPDPASVDAAEALAFLAPMVASAGQV
ncbi:HAD-IIA family hydrolase [Actinopolymorpha alba]|uniref:HAD-IIA family hydrolase n=1 Tax=Actinopolymorpha alba TaxID=533267 RepID=UPI000368DDE7|nr:HAD-IIA family hydrolase [Actinopolymorpha alba]